MHKMWRQTLCLAIALLLCARRNVNAACNRIPHTTALKSPVDENYVLTVDGNPKTYIPGQQYTVSLYAYNDHSFISFMLGLESQPVDLSEMGGLGYFELIDLTETRFSPRCAHLVENTNTHIKTQVKVTWVAPPSGSGCIYLRATVVQHSNVWYKDDGFLTKEMCEEEIDDIENQPTIVEPCCACDEAKYELTFEGKWSRHTHPKDFPANNWRTRFSDIIGASHTVDYRFWQYGELASNGLRAVAEHGSTKTLESELKAKSDEIRTIIKARGIAFPNVTGRTFAVFRVDSRHHLLSFVSMVQPSPDWIVGVSGLELCLTNCTWIEHKELNLYPWDAGTDSGPSYMSADQPQIPDVIRRIKSNYPNDPRSPFYDPTGAPMKPLATLYINRRRLYEKTCEVNNGEQEEDQQAQVDNGGAGDYDNFGGAGGSRDNYNDNVDNNDSDQPDQTRAECALSDWSQWSACSVTCGAGVITRTRHYLKRSAKKKCRKVNRAIPLQDTLPCKANDCGGDIGGGDDDDDNEKSYRNNDNADNDNGNEDDTNMDTANEGESYNRIERGFKSYSQTREDYIPSQCGVSQWSDFSPCLGQCTNSSGGSSHMTGQRQRIRQVWRWDEIYGIALKPNPCAHIKRVETVNCTVMACDQIVPSLCYEQIAASPCRNLQVSSFWYYDHLSDQCGTFDTDKCDTNRNKFKTRELCEQTCRIPRQNQERQQRHDAGTSPAAVNSVDCLVSKWHDYPCNATCGEGMQLRVRHALRTPSARGKACPKHLVQYVPCYKQCAQTRMSANHNNSNKHQSQNSIVCRYSPWTRWTPCTLSCGHNSMRQRTRILLNTESAYKCTDRVEIAKCPIRECPNNDNDD